MARFGILKQDDKQKHNRPTLAHCFQDAAQMTISFNSLFDALGNAFYAIRSANTFLAGGDISSGGLKSVGVLTDNADTNYASSFRHLATGLYTTRDSTRSALDQWKQAYKKLAEDTLIEYVDDDVTLTEKTVEAALKALHTQMVSEDEDVDASTTSATVAAGSSNTGDSMLVASVYRKDGRANELVFAEVIDVVCTSDSYTGGATAGQEVYRYDGEPAALDALAWDWPLGSGTQNGTLTAVDSTQNNAGGNLLSNSDFTDFDDTANLPDEWAALVGSAGTTILKETTTTYDGGVALEFVGDAGGTLTQIAQTFGDSSGTLGELEPNTVYHFACRIQKSASLAAGVIKFALLNASNVIIDDDQGNDVAQTIAHGSIANGGWTIFRGYLVTPKILPTTYKFSIGVSTALTNGESVWIDHLSLTEATEAYTGGPYLSIHSGTTEALLNDSYTATIANNYAGDFQKEFDRCFDLKSKGLQVRSITDASETQADSLIA